MMQETLLRVFVVALGLLMCPRDNPGVEEGDDIIEKDMQMHEERLLRGEEKLDQETPPVSEKIHTDNNEIEDDRNICNEQKKSDRNVIEKDNLLDLDATVTSQDSEGHGADHRLPWGHSIAKSDPSLPKKYNGEPEAALKTSQDAHELKGKDVHTDSSFRDPGRPHGQYEKPEEKEIFSSKGHETPLPHVKTLENETSKKSVAEWERDYLWYIWNTFSVISMIRFFWKYLNRNSQMTQAAASPVTCTADEVQLPDIGTFQHFYAKYVQESSEKKWRKDEFLEGFANDLLEAMRTICDKNGSMVIEDFQMLNACDIIVPFTPPEPYSFHTQLWNNKGSDSSNLSVCGQIKLVENKKIQDCHCQTSDADDMVCLLHCKKVRTEINDVRDGLLCSKNTPFLSKSLVSRWFHSTIKQAWGLISHKYEFELIIHYIDAPGALVIRFKSGKKITFSMNPVITFNNDAYFFITPWSSSDLDTFWTLSLTSYEDHLLEHLSKRLPENACHIQVLEIAQFLHKRQTAMTGSSALKDFHFKTALMHLLLTTDPRHWNPNCVDSRLRDLLSFIERSLEKKVLKHSLIGNPLAEVIELPAELIRAKPVNLFQALVVHNCMYRNAMMHFQEMVRNSYMLVDDYVIKCTERAN